MARADKYRRSFTSFGRWAGRYGMTRLRISVIPPVTKSTPYDWLAGRQVPRCLDQIAALSGGAVTQHDIIEHVRTMRRTR